MPNTAESNTDLISFPDSAIELIHLQNRVFTLPPRPPIDIPADQYGLQRAFYDGQRSVVDWAISLYKQSLEDTET